MHNYFIIPAHYNNSLTLVNAQLLLQNHFVITLRSLESLPGKLYIYILYYIIYYIYIKYIYEKDGFRAVSAEVARL